MWHAPADHASLQSNKARASTAQASKARACKQRQSPGDHSPFQQNARRAKHDASLFSSLQCRCHVLDMRPGHQRHALGLGVLHEASHLSVVYALVGHHCHGAHAVALTPPDQEHPAGRPIAKMVGVVCAHAHVPAADNGMTPSMSCGFAWLLCRTDTIALHSTGRSSHC